jgi:hypothetical protein
MDNMDLRGNNTRYFDVGATKIQWVDGVRKETEIKMVQCGLGQWSKFGGEFAERYKGLGLGEWLCPEFNQTIDI